MADTNIEWTDKVWNPVRGCSLVSAGCENCYAMKTAHRFSGPGGTYEGLTELGPHGPRWNGTITLVPELLDAPLHWKKPQRIFVNSMSDLFHEYVPDEFIDRVFAVMADAGQHTFQILTKRPQRMREYLSSDNVRYSARRVFNLTNDPAGKFDCDIYWPLENVWLGVSVENQTTADERIPLLLQTPTAVRWISAEPLLGQVDLSQFIPLHSGSTFRAARMSAQKLPSINWVVIGGESGPGARPCDLAWIRSIKEQCQAAKVPVFMKQLGRYPIFDRDEATRYFTDKKGGDMAEWPQDLRVREYPV